jgi:MYXO-CTERM domain-containing protein
MRHLTALLCLCTLPTLAHADFGTLACSGTLTAATEGAGFVCDGDLRIGNGVAAFDTPFLLDASGSLELFTLTLAAPSVTLSAGTLLSLAADVRIDATEEIMIRSGDEVYAPRMPTTVAGATISVSGRDIPRIPGSGIVIAGPGGSVVPGSGTILPAIPEPATVWTMAAGLMMLGAIAGGRRRQTADLDADFTA